MKKIVKYQSKRVYKWTRELGIYIKSTSSKAKGHEWKANSCPLFIPLLIIFTERRAREDDNTKLRFSAITLKYLSQHITCKLAFSLTRQLNSFSVSLSFCASKSLTRPQKPIPLLLKRTLFICYLVFSRKQLVYSSTCSLVYLLTRSLVYFLTFLPLTITIWLWRF